MKKSIRRKILSCVAILDIVVIVAVTVIGLNFLSVSRAAETLSNTYLSIEKDFGDVNTNVQNLVKRIFLLSAMGSEMLSQEEVFTSVADVGFAESEALDNAITDLGTHVAEIHDATFKAEYDALDGACDSIINMYKQVYDLHKAGEHEGAFGYYYANGHDAIAAHEENIVLMAEQLEALVAANRATLQRADVIVKLSIIIGGIALILISVFAFAMVISSLKPLTKSAKEMDTMLQNMNQGKADLSARLSFKNKDEVGVLVTGINGFLETLEAILDKIKSESGNIYASVENTSTIVRTSKDDISSVSAVMEELLASMEQANTTLASLNTEASNINNAVNNVTEEIVAGTGFVQTIKNHAVEIKNETEGKKNSTNEMVCSIEDSLKASIDESKNVERIKSLTEDILSIASQTNLLALNASIEAARAGEAGKGFAVVADEIRQLADNSRETANNIQEISEQVIAAVGSLADDSAEMLKYVSESVLKDYDEFAKVANQYYQDADNINGVFDSVSNNANALSNAVGVMTTEIDAISQTINDCTIGVSDATTNTAVILNSITIIQDDSVKNKDISERLQAEVSRFTKEEETVSEE